MDKVPIDEQIDFCRREGYSHPLDGLSTERRSAQHANPKFGQDAQGGACLDGTLPARPRGRGEVFF